MSSHKNYICSYIYDALGSEYYDTVTFANGLAIYGQSIGVADQDTSSLEGFDPFDGILG